ncbi:MAG: hypothetical protein AAFR52_03980 [Pseudomonadota bacterium]
MEGQDNGGRAMRLGPWAQLWAWVAAAPAAIAFLNSVDLTAFSDFLRAFLDEFETISRNLWAAVGRAIGMALPFRHETLSVMALFLVPALLSLGRFDPHRRLITTHTMESLTTGNIGLLNLPCMLLIAWFVDPFSLTVLIGIIATLLLVVPLVCWPLMLIANRVLGPQQRSVAPDKPRDPPLIRLLDRLRFAVGVLLMAPMMFGPYIMYMIFGWLIGSTVEGFVEGARYWAQPLASLVLLILFNLMIVTGNHAAIRIVCFAAGLVLLDQAAQLGPFLDGLRTPP